MSVNVGPYVVVLGENRQYRLLWQILDAAVQPSGYSKKPLFTHASNPFSRPRQCMKYSKAKKISMKWLIGKALINYCSPVMLLSVAAR